MLKAIYDNRLKAIEFFFASSFLLHLIWENAQAPLYAGYTSFSQHFWICFKATATGDMLFMLVIYAVLTLTHEDLFWIAKRGSYTHTMTWILPVIIGGLLATNVELWAVYVDHRWVYGAMPLIPIVNIGWTPVLQMMVVPVIALFPTFFAAAS